MAMARWPCPIVPYFVGPNGHGHGQHGTDGWINDKPPCRNMNIYIYRERERERERILYYYIKQYNFKYTKFTSERVFLEKHLEMQSDRITRKLLPKQKLVLI